MPVPAYVYLAAGVLLLAAVTRTLDRRRKTQRLPPGPSSLAPTVAKVGPKAWQWVIFDAVKDEYGTCRLLFLYILRLARVDISGLNLVT